MRLAIVAASVVAVALFGAWLGHAALDARLLRGYANLKPRDPVDRIYARLLAKPVYARHCASCHGANLQGDRARGAPALADPDWLFGDGRVAGIEETIRFGVRSGHPRAHNAAVMPAYGHAVPDPDSKVLPLGPREIRDVIEYIRRQEAQAFDEAAAKRGDDIYHHAGACFDCHGDDAGGDPAIGAPSMVDAIWLKANGERQSVFDLISNGHAGICPAWEGRLSAVQIRALAIDLSVRAGTTEGLR